MMVGQLCKHVYGCRVVGCAGTDEKVRVGCRTFSRYCLMSMLAMHGRLRQHASVQTVCNPLYCPGVQVKFIKEQCGFDEAWNYRTTSTDKALKEFCPNGIDL